MKKKNVKDIYYYWLDWSFSAKLTSTILNVALWSMAALLIANYVVDARKETQDIGAQWITMGNQILLRVSGKVSEEGKVMETLAKTPSLVAAVQTANIDRANWTAEMITSQDKAWVNGDPSIETTVQKIANDPLSTYLIGFRKSNPEQVEVFVTDIKGLNLAMTDRTSDFLQADEDWWKSTFAEGKGSTYVGPVEYDESSKTYAMNIGVPIRNPETDQVIGVLRGTLDISAMINTLGNLKVGTTGDIVLISSEGIVLYSRTPEHFMKPAPESILALLQSNPIGWKQTTDLDGHPALAAYTSLDGDLGKSLGWHIVITQTLAETSQSMISNLLISLLAGILVAVVAILLCRLVLLDSIVKPLTILTQKADQLSTGNIVPATSDAVNDRSHLRKDEIGDINRAFDRLMAYFQGAASVSTAIADNDLRINVAANSEHDVLGIAFEKMLCGLQSVIGQVAEGAEAVSTAASQLATAADQSGRATNQIATTIQQVALGTTLQSEEVTRTSSAVEQMGRTIAGVARGAQEQAKAIDTASEVASHISAAIAQVTASAASGASGAAEAAEAAQAGAKTVEATIAHIQTIRQNAESSTHKIKEMGKRSEQIDSIVETIDNIASQTNLLALNAAIEAARVESKGEKTVENILQQHMLGAVNLIADMLASGRQLDSQVLVGLAHQARVDSFSITDPDGVIVSTNQPTSLGFRFSEDPRQESSVFRCLLNQRDGVVLRPVRERDQDSKPYIYVGVSRRDCPGIVQAGMPGDVVYRLGGYSRGFAVVSEEIRKLAEHAKEATKEIASLISGIQKTVAEAITVVEDGTHEMEKGSARATEAGSSLATILSTTQTVRQQVEEIVEAVQHMSQSSNELIRVMETIHGVVKENTVGTQELACASSEVTRAIENIARISEENSAAIEEVSASTEEVSAQVEQVSASAAYLMEMARGLQQIIAQFKLNPVDRERHPKA